MKTTQTTDTGEQIIALHFTGNCEGSFGIGLLERLERLKEQDRLGLESFEQIIMNKSGESRRS